MWCLAGDAGFTSGKGVTVKGVTRLPGDGARAVGEDAGMVKRARSGEGPQRDGEAPATEADRYDGDVRVVAEVEIKLEVGEGFVLPDLTGPAGAGELPGVVGVGGARAEDLDATYFDGPDLRLLHHRITLRRRTGGSDAGWHLKLPGDEGGADGAAVSGARSRQELRLPLGRSRTKVPAALIGQVQVHLRGQVPVAVVRLRTRRTVTPLLGPDGTVVAEIAHDQVTATRWADPHASTPAGRVEPLAPEAVAWSEVEVELTAAAGVDGEGLLAAVTDRLRSAGATVTAYASKLEHALAALHLIEWRPLDVPATDGGAADPSAGAASLVVAHLGEQVHRLQQHDPLARTDEPDAIHQMRVATRRLRSALATFRPLFDRTVTDPLRAELAWLGDVLGAARDSEVIRDQLQALLAAEPPNLILGPAAKRIETTMNDRHATAHQAAVTALDDQRYFTLLDALDRLVSQPPLAATARTPGGDEAPVHTVLPLVARTWTRMTRLHKRIEHAAEHVADPPAEKAGVDDQVSRDRLLHELRKAAKRARYAAEAVAPVYGRKAHEWAARMEAIQESLGNHQDTVVIREQLRDIALAAHLDGEDTFIYGRLHALEQTRGQVTEHDYELAWDDARHTSRKWLKA